jgi:hypothetical protein
MKCKGCSGDRFRTKNKALKLYMCRNCGAWYRDGEYLGKKPEDIPIMTLDAGKDDPIAVVGVSTRKKAVDQSTVIVGLPVVAEVVPETVVEAPVEKKAGIFGKLAGMVRAVLSF